MVVVIMTIWMMIDHWHCIDSTPLADCGLVSWLAWAWAWVWPRWWPCHFNGTQRVHSNQWEQTKRKREGRTKKWNSLWFHSKLIQLDFSSWNMHAGRTKFILIITISTRDAAECDDNNCNQIVCMRIHSSPMLLGSGWMDLDVIQRGPRVVQTNHPKTKTTTTTSLNHWKLFCFSLFFSN